jgi:YidC/Oxa1 family membrane protein insertase
MDTYRAFLAIIISFVILLGYQYFFVGFEQPVAVNETVEQSREQASQPAPVQTPAVSAVEQTPPAGSAT